MNEQPEERLHIDIQKHHVRYRQERISLTPAEWELLIIFAQKSGTVLSPATLIPLLPRPGRFLQRGTIADRINDLRTKLNRDPMIVIDHDHGVGYWLRPEAVDLITE